MGEGRWAPETGDRVYVDDPGMAALRDVMRRHTGAEPAPNHHGTVESVAPAEDGFSEETMVYIVFDGPEGEATSNCAPYPLSEVHPLVQHVGQVRLKGGSNG